MFSKFFMASLAILPSMLQSAVALGINCRGSGLCPLATFENQGNVNVMQGLRDAVWQSSKDNSTNYNSGDHIICVSSSIPISISPGVSATGEDGVGASVSVTLTGKIGDGGICLFPQGASLNLGQIRPLTDALLEHGCKTCGSVPIHFVDQGSNDPGSGILTFNYVGNPDCVGNCISAAGQAAPAAASSPPSAKLRARL